ncbi:Cyclophilin-like peptidyl-prolyl cis-trans isomerase domain-containing protein, partial [Cynara cardunculus var. scolymus]
DYEFLLLKKDQIALEQTCHEEPIKLSLTKDRVRVLFVSDQTLMGRRQIDSEPTRWVSLTLLLMGLFSCSLVYMFMTAVLRPNENSNFSSISEAESLKLEENEGGCCRGIDNFELWGAAVKWGSDFKFNSSIECCEACKTMCNGNDGPCLCDSWVFCGNPDACGSKLGEKQKDPLSPDKREGGDNIWTSGLIYGKGEGIVKLETRYGTLHIKASFGPPFALIQGTLEAEGVPFKKIPTEECPIIERGSVAWIGSGPEFFISLANHEEWKKTYTVFGYVLPEDMAIAEKIATLRTIPDVWNNINVSVLEKPVSFSFKRINKVSIET